MLGCLVPATSRRISVVIPAHQEERVLSRCLTALLCEAAPDEFEVVVVANGCTDATADVARRFAGVTVLELADGGKAGALNAGDAAVSGSPRIYLDADVELPTAAVRALAAALAEKRPLIATARRELRTESASVGVRLHYRTWEALQRARGETIGTGVYALNAAGRARFDAFPTAVGDDYFVHGLFRRHERRVVEPPVSVWPPARLPELIAVRSRVVVGNLTGRKGPGTGDRPAAPAQLRSMASEPRAWLGLPVYLGVTLLSRRRAKSRLAAGDLAWTRADRRPG